MKIVKLPYQPRDPRHYRPAIGLIACGGITHHHLTAYRAAGYNVVALCDLVLSRAKSRRDQFYPDAQVYRDYRKLLRRDDIEVVDIATHPRERVAIIRDALRAGKHVLSQKPFVLDLDVGQRLAAGREAGRQSERPLGAPFQLHPSRDPGGAAGPGRGRPFVGPLGPHLGPWNGLRTGQTPDPL